MGGDLRLAVLGRSGARQTAVRFADERPIDPGKLTAAAEVRLMPPPQRPRARKAVPDAQFQNATNECNVLFHDILYHLTPLRL